MDNENQSAVASATTPSIAKLASALAKAQGKFPVIPKDSEVEVKSKEGKFLYKYKYADLTTIIACTRPAMAENGLSFTQGIVEAGFATLIMHESGEKLETGFVPFDLPRNGDMKTIAGLVTYVKRISLTAALGVSADEDVDAAHDESTSGNQTKKESIPPKNTRPADAKAPPPQQNAQGGAQASQSAPPRQAGFNAPPERPAPMADGESFVIPSGSQKGKKLRQFATNDLESMLFQLEALENPGPDSKDLIRNIHVVIDLRKRRGTK